MQYVTREGGVLTDQDIEEIAERLERGELPGKWGRILVGRPRISSEQLKLIGVKVPESAVRAFDEKAARNGQTRSQRLRQLIERDLNEDGA